MTNEEFCRLDSAFYGEGIDDIRQIALRSFTGEELKEFVEFCIEQSKLHQPTVISAVCQHTKCSCKNIDKKHTIKCDDCGEIIWQIDL